MAEPQLDDDPQVRIFDPTADPVYGTFGLRDMTDEERDAHADSPLHSGFDRDGESALWVVPIQRDDEERE